MSSSRNYVNSINGRQMGGYRVRVNGGDANKKFNPNGNFIGNLIFY